MFIRKFKALPTYILFILLSWGCTKIDTTDLGANLLPVVDNIHTFDTSLIVVANNIDPFVCDSVYRSDLHGLGIIPNDPYFGKTTGRIYCELKPLTFPFTFPKSDAGMLVIDSAVLVLNYSHTYGDTLLPQKAQVFQLTDLFDADSTYTTCNVFNYDNSILLGEQTFIPARLADSVHGFRENAKNELRIKLSNSFAQGFLTDSALIFKSNTTFKNYFKGFAVITDSIFGGNAINYFDLTSTGTRVSFYIRTTLSAVKDTSIIDFSFSDSSEHGNSIVHERLASEINGHLSRPATGDSLLYIQTAPGSYVQLKIPGLAGFPNTVIHRAELIVDEAYPTPSDPFLTTPNFLYLDQDTSSSVSAHVPIPCDFSIQSQQPNYSYFGGARKRINDGNGTISQYVFNISRYVQSIVTRKNENATLRLQAPYAIVNQTSYTDRCNQLIPAFIFPLNNIAEGGVRLNGTNNTPQRIRLHIIYSAL
ncbi:MAG: DUF4270 family protein [Ginsengibacter sp.]